ncbi:MAG: MarR family transcriptional regulator [Zetaproteobacteria bacterium]|nr:MAG: MarR family transcriptional regulator [Zetaproteobacteria bacterium]
MKQDLEKFTTLLRELQKIDMEFPLQYAVCLFEIALDEGLCLTDLSEKTGMPLSTISRITSALAKEKARGKNYGLVQIRISPQERRKKQLFLSKKGHGAANSISNIISQK